MSIVTFDTLKFVETLEKAGVSREQASAMATAVRDSHEGAELATKADLREVRVEMQQYESAIRSDLEKLELSLRNDMEKLETGLRHETSSVRQEINSVRQEFNGKFQLMQWTLGVVVAGVMALILKAFF